MQDDAHVARRAAGLEAAGRRGLTLRAGRAVHPVTRLWDTGLALPAASLAGGGLRGVVDIYDGRRHLFHALIVAATEDAPEGEVTFTFKRITPATETPPRDYCEGPEGAPG